MAGTIGAFIISAFTADATVAATVVVGEITVGEIVGAVALTAANFALSAALAPGSSLSQAKQQANLKQTVAARRKLYGQGLVGGTFVFWRAQNGFFYGYLDLLDHQINRFLELRLDNNVVTLNGGGFVTDPASFTFGGVQRVQIITQLGSEDQVALPKMLDDWPGVWTSDHRLRGCACALVVAQTVAAANFSSVYPNGQPQFQSVVEGALVWDPRDGTQTQDDPTTWKYSDNYALCVLDFLLSEDGYNLPYALFAPAIDDWKARANDCDVQVALAAGGTEPRFRLWLSYELDETRKAVYQRILDASGGRVAQRYDGAPVLRLPGYAEPTVVLDDSVVSTFSNLQPGPEAGERYNEIRANIVIAETGYQEDEAKPWRDETSIANEGLQSKLLDLTGCPSHRQARVRMKLEAWRANPKWIGTAVTNAYGMNALGENLIRIKKAAYTFDEVVEATDFPVDSNSRASSITFRSMPAAAFTWDPATEEGTGPNIAAVGSAGDVDAPTLDSVVVDFQGYTTGVEAPQIVALFDDPGRDDFVLYAETRVTNGAIPDDSAAWTVTSVAVGSWRAVSAPLAPNLYDLRARFQAASGQISDWTYVRNIDAT